MFYTAPNQPASTIFMSIPAGVVFPHPASQTPQVPPAPPAQAQPSMTDLVGMVSHLVKLNQTMRSEMNHKLDWSHRESLALRQQVCQLKEEVVGLRTENGVIASRMIEELGLAGKDRQVFQMALKGFQDQSEESQREVKLVNKKVTAMNTIVKKTATNVDAVLAHAETLPILEQEAKSLRVRACGNCLEHCTEQGLYIVRG